MGRIVLLAALLMSALTVSTGSAIAIQWQADYGQISIEDGDLSPRFVPPCRTVEQGGDPDLEELAEWVFAGVAVLTPEGIDLVISELDPQGFLNAQFGINGATLRGWWDAKNYSALEQAMAQVMAQNPSLATSLLAAKSSSQYVACETTEDGVNSPNVGERCAGTDCTTKDGVVRHTCQTQVEVVRSLGFPLYLRYSCYDPCPVLPIWLVGFAVISASAGVFVTRRRRGRLNAV